MNFDDSQFMAAALALGRRGLGRTAPNPAVGALVVKQGVVVGRGWTQDGGRPHAETMALSEAGAAAQGATIYVTLEPCSHHGRTGPCCEAIVAAGIARLVFTIDDANPLVAGQGAAYCRTKGLDVIGGVLADQARRDHRGHILRIARRRPFVSLKLAETADGFVAGGLHDPRLAITGAAANGIVHVMRAMHDAIMVGIGTIVADDPLMTVRLPGVEARPLRIVLDADARIPLQARLLQTRGAPVLILAGIGAPAERVAALEALDGVSLAVCRRRGDGQLDFAAALALLAERGLTRIFCEGGPSVAASLIEESLVDEVLIFTAPRPLGSEGVPTLRGDAKAALASHFDLVETSEIGADRLRRFEAA